MRALSLLDVDGATIALDSMAEAWIAGRGQTIGGSAPVTVTTRPSHLAGERFVKARHTAREVVVPIVVHDDADGPVDTAMAELAYRLDPTRGEVTLVHERTDGTVRHLVGRVVKGLGPTMLPRADTHAVILPVVIRAHDPYWLAASDSTQSWELGEPASFFPIFPLRLTSSELYTSATIANDGHLEAWPVWTITGPGDTIVLRNVTTGAVLDLTAAPALGASEVLTIDTTPGVKTIVGPGGANWFGYRSAGSSLWPLAVGSNAVDIEMSGADSVTSLVSARWRHRYLAP